MIKQLQNRNHFVVKYTFSEAVQFITSDIKISNNFDNIQFMIAFNGNYFLI